MSSQLATTDLVDEARHEERAVLGHDGHEHHDEVVHDAHALAPAQASSQQPALVPAATSI